MAFVPKYVMNDASGVLITDSSSTITLDTAGYVLPTSVSSGKFLISIDSEIILVDTVTDQTSHYEYGVTRAQEGTSFATHSNGSVVKLKMTAGLYSAVTSQLVTNTAKLDLIDVTGSINLDTMSSAVTANTAKVTNATHTGDVTGATALTIVPSAISGKTEVTPATGDYVLLLDATDSLIKKGLVDSFIGGGGGGDVTGPASATDTAIAIYDGTTGKLLKDSVVTINAGAVSGITSLSASGSAVIGGSSITAHTYIDLNTNTAYRKGIRYQDGGTVVWIHQHDTDDHFKLLRYVGGVFQNYPIWIDNTSGNIYFTGAVDVTGNITLSGTVDGRDVAVDGTKLDLIDVTGSINLDTLSAAVTANTAKVTNATHTGDVTGATALTIVPSAISGKSSVTAVSGDYVLLWDATDSALKKANVSDFISAITADSTTTFTNKRISKRVVTLTDAATIAINCDITDLGKVTLAASRTLGNPSGTPTDGQTMLLAVKQGGSGSYTLTIDTTSAGGYRFGSDVTGLTLSTAVGKIDLILVTYLSDITGWAVSSTSLGYPA